MQKAKIKEIANLLSDLFIADPEEYCKAGRDYIYQYGSENAIKIFKLAEVYVKIKRGVMSREEGLIKSKEILNKV